MLHNVILVGFVSFQYHKLILYKLLKNLYVVLSYAHILTEWYMTGFHVKKTGFQKVSAILFKPICLLFIITVPLFHNNNLLNLFST